MFWKLLTFALILTFITLPNPLSNSIAMAGVDDSLAELGQPELFSSADTGGRNRTPDHSASSRPDTGAYEDRSAKSDLLRKYAPVLHFHPEERIYPWGINSMLDNADLKRLKDNREIPMPVRAVDLAANNDDECYLDIRNINPYHNDANATGDLEKMCEGFPFTIYGRLVEPQQAPTYIALQYWFFYPYNNWYNNHEGDWEMIQIHYSKDRRSPDQLTTSHHHSGSVIAWDEASKIEGTHPRIFVAKGSHGNWLTSGNHIVGRIWSQVPVFRDETSENGLALYPEYMIDKVDDRKQKYILQDITDELPSSWLYWNGKWGDVEWLVWGSRGPESPGLQGKWENPIEWGNEPARSSFWAYFGSPGYMHIYDSYGNHVGFTKIGEGDEMGEVEGNIPGTYFYAPASDEVPQDCAWINTSENLRLEIVATGSGSFNLSFDLDLALTGRNQEKMPITIEYKDVQIAKGGTATVNIELAKLADRIKAPGGTEAELEELEDTMRADFMAKASPIERARRKEISDRMEAELEELEDMIRASSIERAAKRKASGEVDIKSVELELENMIEVARLSRKLVRERVPDRVEAELEDTIEGDNLLERLLKPILIMEVDFDGNGTVDELRQPDKISRLEL